LTRITEGDVVRKHRTVQTPGRRSGAADRRDRRRNMTTTTTGTNGFPVRYIVMAVVAAALATVIIAISQQGGTDIAQSVSAPRQAGTEVATQSANANGLADALESGKLDEGSGGSRQSTATASASAPTTVEVTGQGSSYDALIAGKFGVDFGPNADVRYVRAPGAASGGLTQALAENKLDAAPSNTPSTPSSAPAPRTVEVAGQGSSYDALIAGKFGVDFGPNADVLYVGMHQTAPGGLWKALDDGKLDESVAKTQPSTAPSYADTVTGGRQE
jgi:hypothetical protein